MSPMNHSFVLVTLVLFSYFSASHALPLAVRQDGQPVTVQTVHTTTTPIGPMLQTCVITLTPITDAQGNAAFEEVSDCKLSPDTGGSTNNNGAANNPPPSSGESGGNAAISVGGFKTVTASGATASATDTGSSSSAGSSSSDSQSSSSVSSATDSASSATDSAASANPTDASNSGSTSDSSDNNTSSNADAGATGGAASDTSPTAEAAQVTTSATSALAAAAVPGKNLNVLPIGLGVFAGISVIALIVVGLVTYERTKYRKAFRQRKLAETGAAMGYGGMAQRT